MFTKTFWTEKRLEKVSNCAMTLFQAFLIAWILGGIFDKITTVWAKIMFVISMIAFFIAGIVFADRIGRKET